MDQSRRLRRRAVVIPLGLFVVAFLVFRFTGLDLPRSSSANDSNPFAGREPSTYADTAVAAAARSAAPGDAETLRRLAAVPTAVWLTPEAYAPGTVGPKVEEIVSSAREAGRVPVLVVYGIPDRDCSGGESSGGLPADQYAGWVEEIGEAAGQGSVVILEPDALASASECGQVEARTTTLRAAVDELVGAGPAVYLDAGHSDWTSPDEMARLLRDSGIDRARGFATNVSGYEGEREERAYADEVSRLTGGAHFVTDTGRNGNGSTGEWCNPSGRALGREPAVVDDDTDLDAYLWIKPPGESDGTCNGGPAAGEFWVPQAIELASGAGW